MKKKFLLAVIPALMVLSSCAGLGAKKEAEVLKQDENVFVEDTAAHEEMFGIAKTAGNLGVRKTANPGSVLKPKIGVQYMKSDDNDNDDTKIAIRYVAAISSLDVKAEWYRGVAKQDSNTPKEKYTAGSYYTKNSTIGYTTINNDGHETKAAEAGAGYNYFVVYTLREIPFKEFQYSYMAAYLVLRDSDTDEILQTSDVVAVNIGQTHYFSFGVNEYNGRFIEGTIGGNPNQIREINDEVIDTENNDYEEVLNLNLGDNFGVFEWTPTTFKFFGNANFANDHYHIGLDVSVSTNYSKVGATREYRLYINKSNMFGLVPSTAVTTGTRNIYLDVSNWGPSDADYAIWLHHGTSHDKWILHEEDKVDNLFVFEDIDFDDYTQFNIVRINPTAMPTNNQENWDGVNKWNQTADITYNNGFILANKFRITGFSGGDNDPYVRSEYIPA